jgi:uncharacterized protein (TIGR02271 family)
MPREEIAMLKTDFLGKYPDALEGTVVLSQDGKKLGKISAMNEDSFVVQKGFFFPKDFIFRYEDIQSSTSDGDLIVDYRESDIGDWKDPSYSGWSQVEDINSGRHNATPLPEYKDRYSNWRDDDASMSRNEDARMSDDDEIRIPVMEEELEAQKTVRKAGEVRLRKIVHSELRHFTVPVMKEEVVVERAPVHEDSSADMRGDSDFKEETIAMPVMEEEVTAVKRPVVKEEVRLRKKRTEEQREVSDTVRKEEVEVDEDVPGKRRKLG